MSRIVPLPSFALILLSLFFFITTIASAETHISDFPNCLPTDCNGLKISYPFWNIESENSQYCGYEDLGINCSTISGVDRPTPMMYFGGDFYYVRNLTDTSITLVDYDVSSVFPVHNECPRVKHRIDLGKLPLYFSWQNLNLSFHFNCTSVPRFASEIRCLNNGGPNRSYVYVIPPDTPDYDWGETCVDEVVTTVKHVYVRDMELGPEVVFGALRNGFELNWTTTTDDCEKCEESDGACGHNNSTGFMCFCLDGTSTKDHCKVKETEKIPWDDLNPMQIDEDDDIIKDYGVD